MGLFGQPNVEKLEARRDLRGLANALSNPDAGIRGAAARALERLDDPTAVPLIVERLKSVGDQVRRGKADPKTYDEGVGVLRTMGAPAVQHLLAALRDSPGNNVVYAFLLGKLGEPLGVEPLLEASRDASNSSLRGSAVAGLGVIGTPAATERLKEIFHTDTKFDVRGGAAVALAGHKLTGAYETFMAALDGDDRDNRVLAAAGLEVLNDTRAVERLSQVAADDSDPRVRDIAKRALAQLAVRRSPASSGAVRQSLS